jgi:LmbE family N-acetylglucosaminyl deacetylase
VHRVPGRRRAAGGHPAKPAHPQAHPERAAEIREAESIEAARIAGVNQVVFLREPDGMLQPTLELRKKLVREIRRFKPEVVICSDPTVVWAGDNYINHPDHRAAGTAALDAVFPAAGQPNLFEELESGRAARPQDPQGVRHRALSKRAVCQYHDTIEIKIAALRAHVSQMRDWDPEPMVKQWAAERAAGKEMDYAESFRVITLEDV